MNKGAHEVLGKHKLKQYFALCFMKNNFGTKNAYCEAWEMMLLAR